MAQPTLSERLADYVCGLSFEDVPKAALDRLKATISHDLVLGMLGSDSAESAHALAFIRGEAAKPGACTVIGQATPAAPIDAAFANAVAIRALRQEDTLMPSGIHAGAIIFPTALALGERYRCNGREILTAMIAGFDVSAKLDRASPATRSRRTGSHVYGAFAAAATATKLMGLDREQTATAIAYAGNLGAMIMAGFENHQYGVLARNGMTAAYLGQALAPAPRDALEGDSGFFVAQVGAPPTHLEEAIASLGVEFEVVGSTLKSFPCALSGAVAVRVTEQIVAKHGVRAADVARVVVRRPDDSNDQLKHGKGPFASLSHALSSVPFALALVLLDGSLTLDRLYQHQDAAALELAQRVDVVHTQSDRELYHRVDLLLKDGSVRTGDGDHLLLDDPDPVDIARAYRSALLDAEGASTLADTVSRFEELEEITALTDQLVRPARVGRPQQLAGARVRSRI